MRYASAKLRRHRLIDCDGEAAGRLLRSLLGAALLALVASALLSVLAPQAASSAEPKPTLRSAVAVAGDVVTLGDFFENAGPLAERALFRSPDLGTTGPVPAVRVVEMARAAGLADADAGGLVEVAVTRLARPVEADEIARLIAAEVLRRPGRDEATTLADLQVQFDGPLEPHRADQRSAVPARVVSLTLTADAGRFEALVDIDQGERSERLRLRGTVVETVPVLILTRTLSRGDVVETDDVRLDRQARNRVGVAHPLVDAADVVGLQARRPLRSGQALTSADFARPQVVARGETVSIVFRTASLQVTARGQTQQGGAVGELVAVLNPQSRKIIHAVVAGPGRVEVSAPSTSVAALSKVAQ